MAKKKKTKKKTSKKKPIVDIEPATKYRKAMDKRAYNTLAMGLSKASLAAELKIARDTIYDWCDKDSTRFKASFSDSVQRGEDAGFSMFEKCAIALATGAEIPIELFALPDFKLIDPKSIDRGMIQFVLNTRFHRLYGDRVKVEDETPYSVLRAAMKKVTGNGP